LRTAGRSACGMADADLIPPNVLASFRASASRFPIVVKPLDQTGCDGHVLGSGTSTPATFSSVAATLNALPARDKGMFAR
jgi:hypothetical protein